MKHCPKVGDAVRFYNPVKQIMRVAKVVHIHPARVPMSLSDVLKYYEPPPKLDRYIPVWEKPSRWDRVICQRPSGGFVILHERSFDSSSKYFCAEIVTQEK